MRCKNYVNTTVYNIRNIYSIIIFRVYNILCTVYHYIYIRNIILRDTLCYVFVRVLVAARDYHRAQAVSIGLVRRLEGPQRLMIVM